MRFLSSAINFNCRSKRFFLLPSKQSKISFLPSSFSFSSSANEEQQHPNQRQRQQQGVTVTHTTTNKTATTPGTRSKQSFPSIQSDATALVESLLQRTSTLIDPSQSNIIAFSGGVDSSLAASLVYQAFHEHRQGKSKSENKNKNNSNNLKAILGISNSLPQRQLHLAREVADFIGIELMEVPTKEGTDEQYIANKGQACFICKSHLYSALEAVTQTAHDMNYQQQQQQKNEQQHEQQHDAGSYGNSQGVILYNGTNKDDTHDPTRLGLIAAKNFSVQSPLLYITKDQVRIAAKHLNLPNYNYAASPCLRSRLALGVEATQDHLDAVQKAEEKVRDLLGLDVTMDLRVRMLAGKRAMVELDRRWFVDNNNDDEEEEERQQNRSSGVGLGLDVGDGSAVKIVEDRLRREGFEHYCRELGFDGGIGLRPFKSGSVST